MIKAAEVLHFFSATVSDKNIIHSPFLKDYRRFNVALMRARKKFLFVASPYFFESFPMTEKELTAHEPFVVFFDRYYRAVGEMDVLH